MKSWSKILLSLFFLMIFLTGVVHAEPVKIGITWMGQSDFAENFNNAFTEAVKQLIPDIDIEFQRIEDITDTESLTRVIRRFEKEKDGIVLLRSNGAKWLSENQVNIPTFIGATNNPEAIGAVRNMAEPEGLVTGVTYYLPYEVQFQIFEQLLPDMKSILILLEKNHASTAVDRKGTMEACKKKNITYHEKVSESAQDSIDAVNEYKDKISAFIIGSNGLNLDNAEQLIRAGGGTPFLSYLAGPVKVGALAGFIPDDVKRGKMLAQSVYDVLVMKKPIKEVPVKMDPDPKFLLNGKVFQKLGIEVPYSILKHAEIME